MMTPDYVTNPVIGIDESITNGNLILHFIHCIDPEKTIAIDNSDKSTHSVIDDTTHPPNGII